MAFDGDGEVFPDDRWSGVDCYAVFVPGRSSQLQPSKRGEIGAVTGRGDVVKGFRRGTKLAVVVAAEGVVGQDPYRG